MQKSNGAENQQVTDIQIAWLAGIMDAEGSIGLYKNGNGNFYARVTITNTSILMLDAIKQILDVCELSAYIKENERQKNKNWKPRWQIVFSGSTKPEKILNLLLPHLVTKRYEAELVLEYIESRRSKRYQNREGKQWVRAPLTRREQEIIDLVKEQKNVRHLRDYTRNTA